MTLDYPNAVREAQRIVLASSSPRRAQLLALITKRFEIAAPKVDEGVPTGPEDLLTAARRKAEAVWPDHREAIVVGADTGVFLAGRHFGKPRDLAEAREMLGALAGRWHTVVTGVHLLSTQGREEALVETRVKFHPLSPEEIDWYLASEDVLDKAGAYAIQGRAGVFVERIEGDFFNVMGFPIATVYRLLKRLGWRPLP